MSARIQSWLALGMVVLVLLIESDASAQCGATRSSCSSCHDGTTAPLPARAAWHEDHAFADVCAHCHGGDPASNDVTTAHLRRRDPLDLSGEACRPCHAGDAEALVERYTKARAAGPPETTAAGAPPACTTAPTAPPRHGRVVPNVALIATMAMLGLGAAAIARRGRSASVSHAPPSERPKTPLAPFRGPWSPYVAGIGLGLLVTVAVGLYGHRLSGAAAFQHLSGFIGRRIAPSSMYWRDIVPTGITWDVMMTIGTVLGAFAAALAGGVFRVRNMPDAEWSRTFGPRISVRYVLAFVGAFLTEVGGGIAGGCTASLAVSGGALLAPSAFLFMAGMFLGGIPMARLVDRKAKG